ncbi:hypothetical protein ABFP05_11930 [Acinetobacter baumannii]
MSDYMHMTLEQLRQEHAELLEFNEKLDRRCKAHKADAQKFKKKVDMIESMFVVPSNDNQMTLKAIRTILERVGEA